MPEKSYITLSQGPRFTIPFSGFLLMVCIGLMIYGIDQIIEHTLLSIAFIAGSALLLPIFLDYQGIQIDPINQRIRVYKSYFGIKRGAWESLAKFSEIALKWERLSHRSGSSLMRVFVIFTPTAARGQRATTNDAFCIYLTNPDTKAKFEIADFQTYNQALKFQKRFSTQVKLPRVDYYEPILIAAQARREEVESRRGRR